MDQFEKQLRQLGRLEPGKQFCQQAKGRLMHRISIAGDELWFKNVLKKVGIISPSPSFVSMARMRLLARIIPGPQRVFAWALLVKRVAASTLVMLLAGNCHFVLCRRAPNGKCLPKTLFLPFSLARLP